MFYLWHECNTPPWQWTGDPTIYPEDVNAFMKMVELENSGEKHRSAKAERKASKTKPAGVH